MDPVARIVTPPRTAREQLLNVAESEGWEILHDLGLHVVFRHRQYRRLAMQFDYDGQCVWCEGQSVDLRPVEVAFRALTQFRPLRVVQDGSL